MKNERATDRSIERLGGFIDEGLEIGKTEDIS
jgi:hypothetical protein